MCARLVDFHCHLDLYQNPEAAITEADAAGVYTLTVTTTPLAWPRNLELTRKTGYVRAALGLHPQLVAERYREISIWERHLPETRYVGEVGLDAAPRYYGSLELQKQVFEHVLKQCAKAGSKVLTIHSVRAAKPLLDLVERHLVRENGVIAVLHWFTGSKSEVRRAVDLGCYFSVNARMLQTERGRDMVLSLPRGRLLTETDGPFTEHGGRPARPADVAHTLAKLADLWKVTPENMGATVRANLKDVLEAAGCNG
jgi:TatD DNase family protein